MNRTLALKRAAAAAPLLFLLSSAANEGALAHGFAGDRFFPATIVVDDPAVADELSLPTVSKFKNGDGLAETDAGGEFSKRITEHFGVSIGENWTHIKPGADGTGGANGFGNLETTFKYQFLTNPEHELMLSAGLSLEWANTGAKNAGSDGFNTYTPTLYFGKGFGDLPAEFNLIRPFAITGQFGYAVPGQDLTDGALNARTLEWGLTLQYSLPYLNSNVKAIEGPGSEFLKHLIPIVEASLSTPLSNFDGPQITTGTINPGVIWSGQYMQFGVEATIPINRESGKSVGAIAQVHFYLDDMFPSFAKPLFAGDDK